MRLKSRTIAIAAVLAAVELHFAERPLAAPQTQVQSANKSAETFTNPLLRSGADPWTIYKNGWYYYTHTTGRNLTLRKTRSIANLAAAEVKVVWTPPPAGPYSKDIWAPELHFIAGKWYLYFAADDGRNRNHRLYVLENGAADPLQGTWIMKGKLTTPGDHWSIDASVFEYEGHLYLIWSGWEGDENGRQDIYICLMLNPWTTTGDRVLISKPTYGWETIGDIARPGPDDKAHVDVNEGPEALVKNGRVFVIFSASGCWTDQYALGMIWANRGSPLLDQKSWHKAPVPVFSSAGSGSTGVYGAGHNSFFRSPDGTEDWILYHANPEPGQGCGTHRNPRAQPFRWTKDGMPDFGKPVSAGLPLPVPSERKHAAAAN